VLLSIQPNITTKTNIQIQFTAVDVAATTSIGPNHITVTASGQTSAPSPFTIDGPDHMIVVLDSLGVCSGCTSTVERDVTYQVIKFSGSPAFVIPIGENITRSGWNCYQSNGGYGTTLCTSGVDTGTDGTFGPDVWTMVSDSYTPPGCGYNIVDHWQWCAAPKTIGTLNGYTPTDSISINGSIRPPDVAMPPGTIINP
jgi:hypothetical protein